MKQYGVPEQETIDVLNKQVVDCSKKKKNKQVVDAWKDINEELLRPTVMPMPVLMRILNFTKCVDVVYKRGDAFTQVIKEGVNALFVDPVPLE